MARIYVSIQPNTNFNSFNTFSSKDNKNETKMYEIALKYSLLHLDTRYALSE